MLPGRGEHDEVQDGEHEETGDDGDGEQNHSVGGGQHLGEGTRRVPRPPVPPADRRQTEAEDDRPHDGDGHLLTRVNKNEQGLRRFNKT